jgi:hypothetical protein
MRVIIAALFLIFNISLMSLPRHSVSSTNVSVGDTVIYTIKFPPNTLIDFNLPTINGLERINRTIEKNPDYDAYNYYLQVFSVDNVMIPTVSIHSINGIAPIDLPPLFFTIQSLISPTMNQLNDIAPLLSVFHIGWGMALITLIIIFIVCALLLSYWRKKNAVMATQPNKPTEPPHKVAQKQLNALLKSLTNDPHAIKASYFKLTEILFNYLTVKIQLNLLESTTVEVQRLFQLKKPLPIDLAKDVIRVSKEMDHYKFSQNPSYKIDNIKKTIKDISTIIKGIENDH